MKPRTALLALCLVPALSQAHNVQQHSEQHRYHHKNHYSHCTSKHHYSPRFHRQHSSDRRLIELRRSGLWINLARPQQHRYTRHPSRHTVSVRSSR